MKKEKKNKGDVAHDAQLMCDYISMTHFIDYISMTHDAQHIDLIMSPCFGSLEKS